MKKLGMSIVVRDEEDVIVQNIEFHHAMGVESFAVLDNGSRDATFDRLRSLAGRYDLALFREEGPFDQARRADRLAAHLRSKQGVDWVISGDADEFWLPKTGSLACLTEGHPVKLASRLNFVPSRAEVEAGLPFHQFRNLVRNPLGSQPPQPDARVPLLYPMLLRTFPGKVACATEGLVSVHFGNHAVSHAAGKAERTGLAVVLHYPVRDFTRFESKVRNHGANLAGVTGGDAWHVRRWVQLSAEGRLREAYDEMLLSPTDIVELRERGVLDDEPALQRFFTAPR